MRVLIGQYSVARKRSALPLKPATASGALASSPHLLPRIKRSFAFRRIRRRRGMFASGVEHSAQVYQCRPIEPQCDNGCPTCWRQSNNHAVFFGPGKVGRPGIVARMVEWRKSVCQWIRRLDEGVLVVVTALARRGEVAEDCAPAPAARDDVLNRERVGRELGLTTAVFAALRRLCHHGCTQPRRNPFTRHWQRQANQDRAALRRALRHAGWRVRQGQRCAWRSAPRERR